MDISYYCSLQKDDQSVNGGYKAIDRSYYFFPWDKSSSELFDKINNYWSYIKHLGGQDKDVSISMFDNGGRLLWTRNRDVDSSRSVDISVSNLRPGMYYLKVESKTVRKTTRSSIKEKWRCYVF